MAQAFERFAPQIQHHIVNTLRWADLRPLQQESAAPLLAGEDALLLAPTSGGKTEAAFFPVLSRMEREQWRDTSVLYLAPLKALLNNVEHRLRTYTSWVGRTVDVRHGDTSQGQRRRQLLDRPDVLLTTPESLESMLVSPTVDNASFFGGVRTVVIDEVHAFAGDDRGWHLLALLERITALTGRPLQRVGLSATVGNPEELLDWLRGSSRAAGRPARVIAPAATGPEAPDLQLDFVGNLDNAAEVISRLHRGEKRLVFTDSRSTVEELGSGLNHRGVDTYLSHSSLSLSERRRSEQAFAEATDCVIVSTSTLELGIDIGDLDRSLQIGAPLTVASLLQRLGRTGRRPGTRRNMLFLEPKTEQLLVAAGLLLLWSEGYVEPVQAPPSPRHILAQQLLALALQKGQLVPGQWAEPLTAIGLGTPDQAAEVERAMLSAGHLDEDSGLLFLGPETHRRYGGLHFRDLMVVFTVAQEFTVFHGRQEIGTVDPTALALDSTERRLLVLAGRPWEITFTDWRRGRVHVEPAEAAHAPKWSSGKRAYSWELTDAMRRTLLGARAEGLRYTGRAEQALDELAEEYALRVDADTTVVLRDERRTRWWTWGGLHANALLVAALEAVDDTLLGETRSFDNLQISLRGDATATEVAAVLREARNRYGHGLEQLSAWVHPKAVEELKFAELLPEDQATGTLAERATDRPGALRVLQRPVLQADQRWAS